jgi:hypothetical protein
LWLAGKTVALLFGSKGIAPERGAAEVFELVLIGGFGAECLLVGFVAGWFLFRWPISNSNR